MTFDQFMVEINRLKAKWPPSPKWEGHGPQKWDLPEPAAGALKNAEKKVLIAFRGLSVQAAINVLHDQRRPDGRPSLFIPVLE